MESDIIDLKIKQASRAREIDLTTSREFKITNIERLEVNQRKAWSKQFSFEDKELEQEAFNNFFEELLKDKVENMLQYGVKNNLPFSEHAKETWNLKHLKAVLEAH